MTLSLILTFAVIFLLLGLALMWSSWPRWLKALLALGITAMYFVSYQTALALLGIPSTEALPERFVMLASVVEEPRGKNPGAVYLWISPLTEGKTALQPRAYKLPYSKPLHQMVNDGIKKGRDGVSQMGSAEMREGTGKGSGWLSPGNDEQEIKIRDLPVPQLPEK
jgi:hypothetical protein